MSNAKFEVTWVDSGRNPTEKPDPAYPNGIDLDVSKGAVPFCVVTLPYPAPRCGLYYVKCDRCAINGMITTAGRPDDPRSVRFGCLIKYDS